MTNSRFVVPFLLGAVLVAGACGDPNDDEAVVSGLGAAGSAGAGAEDDGDVVSPVAPFDPPASGYAELNLYPNDPPNYLATAPAKTVDPTSGVIRDVSIPTLRRYPVAEGGQWSGVAFVAFPGGAYNVLDMETQAATLAARLGPLGVSVFGLESRVGAGSSDPRRDALLDAERALRLLRTHAAEWGLDPSRIGTASWSAGSHLALMLAGNADPGDPTSADPVERASSRPDFMAVMCPWADGASASPFSFNATSPPIYIAHAEDDTDAPIALARAIDQQLRALGTLEHLEVYATGGHEAFNVGAPTATGRDWPDRYLAWLGENRLIPE